MEALRIDSKSDAPGPPEITNDQDHELPTYAHVQTQRQQSREASGAALTREHHRFLEDTKGKKWLSMFVQSRASNAASLPVFFEGDTISGRVEVDLDKAESSKGVTISVSEQFRFVSEMLFALQGAIRRSFDNIIHMAGD